MRCAGIIVSILSCTVLAAGCNTQSPSQATELHESIATSISTTLPPLTTAAPTAVAAFGSPMVEMVTARPPSPLPSNTTSISPDEISWQVYRDFRGVLFEYPADWEATSVANRIHLARRPPEAEVMLPDFNFERIVDVVIHPVDLAVHGDSNSGYQSPNEHDGEVYWETPLTVEMGEGSLFVWGRDNFDGHDRSAGLWRSWPSLRARYYSASLQLEINLSIPFDDMSTVMAQESGLTATVTAQFPIFDQIIRSVRFVPPMVEPTASATATITSSIAWETFVTQQGVAVEYPDGWEIRTIQMIPDNYYFSPPGFHPPETISSQQLMLEVYHRPLADREIANPYSWQDASERLHWATPIAFEQAEGWLLVWGDDNFDGQFPYPGLWEHPAMLMAIYYDEQQQLDIRISDSFDDESTLLAQQIGLAETVAQRYPVFDHMMRSLQFVEPMQP
jgi:hypothetical protein